MSVIVCLSRVRTLRQKSSRTMRMHLKKLVRCHLSWILIHPCLTMAMICSSVRSLNIMKDRMIVSHPRFTKNRKVLLLEAIDETCITNVHSLTWILSCINPFCPRLHTDCYHCWSKHRMLTKSMNEN